jgi:hypothetical protein
MAARSSALARSPVDQPVAGLAQILQADTGGFRRAAARMGAGLHRRYAHRYAAQPLRNQAGRGPRRILPRPHRAAAQREALAALLLRLFGRYRGTNAVMCAVLLRWTR